MEGGTLGSRPADQGAAREKISGVGVGVGGRGGRYGGWDGWDGWEGWEGGFGRGVGAWEFGLESVEVCRGFCERGLGRVENLWPPSWSVCRAFLGVCFGRFTTCVCVTPRTDQVDSNRCLRFL